MLPTASPRVLASPGKDVLDESDDASGTTSGTSELDRSWLLGPTQATAQPLPKSTKATTGWQAPQ
jgi:hypothetical protein